MSWERDNGYRHPIHGKLLSPVPYASWMTWIAPFSSVEVAEPSRDVPFELNTDARTVPALVDAFEQRVEAAWFRARFPRALSFGMHWASELGTLFDQGFIATHGRSEEDWSPFRAFDREGRLVFRFSARLTDERVQESIRALLARVVDPRHSELVDFPRCVVSYASGLVMAYVCEPQQLSWERLS